MTAERDASPVGKSVDTVESAVVYLRYRVTEMFDKGATGTPRWTLTDARHVRRVLDALDSASATKGQGSS